MANSFWRRFKFKITLVWKEIWTKETILNNKCKVLHEGRKKLPVQIQNQLIRYCFFKKGSGCYIRFHECESICHVARKATIIPGCISRNITCNMPEWILSLSPTDIRHCASRKIKTVLPKIKERQKKNDPRKTCKGWWKETGLCSLGKGWEGNMINFLPVTWNVAGRKRMIYLPRPWWTEYNRLTLQQEISKLTVKKVFPLLRKDWDILLEKLEFPIGGLKAQLSLLRNDRQSHAGTGAGLPR